MAVSPSPVTHPPSSRHGSPAASLRAMAAPAERSARTGNAGKPAEGVEAPAGTSFDQALETACAPKRAERPAEAAAAPKKPPGAKAKREEGSDAVEAPETPAAEVDVEVQERSEEAPVEGVEEEGSEEPVEALVEEGRAVEGGRVAIARTEMPVVLGAAEAPALAVPPAEEMEGEARVVPAHARGAGERIVEAATAPDREDSPGTTGGVSSERSEARPAPQAKLAKAVEQEGVEEAVPAEAGASRSRTARAVATPAEAAGGEESLGETEGSKERSAPASEVPAWLAEDAQIVRPEQAVAVAPPRAAEIDTNLAGRSASAVATPTSVGAVSGPIRAESAAAAQEPPAPEAQETFEQVVLGLRGQFDARSGKAEIRLEPPNLGTVRVSVSLEKGSLTANFQSSSDLVRGLLKENFDQLKSVLESRGVTVDRLAVADMPRDGAAGPAPLPGSNSSGSGQGAQPGQQEGAAHDGRSAGQYQQDPRGSRRPGGAFATLLGKTVAAGPPVDLVA